MYSINFGHQNPEHIRVLHSKGKKLNQPKEVEEERHTQKLSKQIGLVCIFPNLFITRVGLTGRGKDRKNSSGQTIFALTD